MILLILSYWIFFFLFCLTIIVAWLVFAVVSYMDLFFFLFDLKNSFKHFLYSWLSGDKFLWPVFYLGEFLCFHGQVSLLNRVIWVDSYYLLEFEIHKSKPFWCLNFQFNNLPLLLWAWLVFHAVTINIFYSLYLII